MNTKLNTESICQLQQTITEYLIEKETKGSWNLEIEIDEEDFDKIDEDLFYKLKKGDKFIPSGDKIVLSFSHNNITLKKAPH